MSEINIQTQLELALQLLTQEQRDAWANEMKILQLQCSLSDAKRRIKELEERNSERSKRARSEICRASRIEAHQSAVRNAIRKYKTQDQRVRALQRTL